MALKGFEHVGMTVANIDTSLAFYVDLLGLSVVLRLPDQGGAERCFLSAGNGMLEIAAPGTGALPASDVTYGRAGLRHLTFAFDDIEKTYAMLEAAGVKMLEAPRAARSAGIVQKVAFCRDPDGIVIELCEH